MSMNKVFNTSFETSLRISLLLDISKEAMGLDEICTADFIATYAGEFTDSEASVNGENRFMYSEYATRRELAGIALKELVLRGIAEPVMTSKGFAYRLTKEGRRFSACLESSYACEYRSGASFACGYIKDVGVDEVINVITRKASEGMR